MMLRILLISLALAFAAPAASQEKKKDEAKKPTAQQQRHAECNRKSTAKKLKGEERKQFMTECLRT
jgi:hypothetical protein